MYLKGWERIYLILFLFYVSNFNVKMFRHIDVDIINAELPFDVTLIIVSPFSFI